MSDITTTISNILAPVVMISAGGLLNLGLQNKYSALADRLRALRGELRGQSRGNRSSDKGKREVSLMRFQIGRILTRLQILRNSILLLYLSILFFLFSSILSAVPYIGIHISQIIIFIVFTVGLLSFFLSIVFAITDIIISYDVIVSGAGLEPHSITSAVPLTQEEKVVRESDEDDDED